MSQKLILPLNDARISASWKWGTRYQKEYGSIHCGQDMYGSQTIYSCGNGTVIDCGWDDICGNIAIVRYNDVVNHFDGGHYDVIARFYHMSQVLVKKGQKVTKDTRIGIIGNTGILTDGIHLHIEFDKDVNYPYHTPTISRNSNILKAGLRGERDTTVDPMRVLHCKTSAPDNQHIEVAGDRSWVDPRDGQIPRIQ